jgi:hypothetical protein
MFFGNQNSDVANIHIKNIMQNPRFPTVYNIRRYTLKNKTEKKLQAFKKLTFYRF